MGYDPRYAMVNSQMRSQGMRSALDDFMSFFKAKRAAKDEGEEDVARQAVTDTSAELGGLEGRLGGVKGAGVREQDVANIEAQAAPNGFSLLNPGLDREKIRGDAMQETSLGNQVSGTKRRLASVKAAYANKYGKEAVSAEDFLTKDDLNQERLAQSRVQTEGMRTENRLNEGLLAPRVEAAKQGNVKLGQDIDQSSKLFPGKLEDSNLQPVLTRAQIGKTNAEAAAEANKPSNLPLDTKTEVTGLATKNAGKVAILNQIKGYQTEFNAAKTDDDKVRIGRQMLKVLNSPEGSDAVGAEEVKRLGDALEYNIADPAAGLGIKPGKFHGRDLAGFGTQVQATIDAIDHAVKSNRGEVDRLMGRPTAAEPATVTGGAGPIVVKSQTDYTALPAGAEYIDPNGQRRRKK